MKRNQFERFTNQLGQASMEAVLILIVVTVIAIQISSLAKSQGLAQKVVEGPWSSIRGMVEDGVWVRHTESKSLHPNHLIRHQSRRGDDT